MAYVISDGIVGVQAIADTSTTQNEPLGRIVRAYDPTRGAGEFIYLLGVASTAVGSLVSYTEDDYSTSLATANDKGNVAIAMSANVASQYGWYQISGKGSVKALTGFADNADCYLTSTAGSIDDAVVSGDLIYRMKGASAVASGLADVDIQRPYTLDGDILDSTTITASSTEINYLDLTTGPGTQEATKAVVADANVNTGVSKVTELHIGASGSEVQVAATPAEINAAADDSTRLIDGSGDLTLTVASHNKKIIYNDADGATYTLWDATGSGASFEVMIGTTVTSNSVVIQAPDADNTIHGTIMSSADDTASTAIAWSSADTAGADTVTLDGSTKGGIKGDYLKFTDIAADTWLVHGQTTSTGSEATPFSAAVS